MPAFVRQHWTFFVVIFVYSLTISGNWGGDNVFYLRLAENFVSDARLDVDPNYELLPGLNGRYYLWQDPGLSVVILPFVIAGRLLAAMAIAAGYQLSVTPLLLNYFMPFCGAAAIELFIGLLRQFGATPFLARSAGLVAAFATQCWLTTILFYTEPLQLLLFMVLVKLTLAGRWSGAAAALFLLALVKSYNLLALVPLLLWLLFARHRHTDVRRGVLWLMLAATAVIAVFLLYNHLRFGSPFISGYYIHAQRFHVPGGTFGTPLWEGFYGLMFSSGKGLIWYSPPCLLALVLWPRFIRCFPGAAFLCGGLALAVIVPVACFWGWHGEYSWGPRLIMPIMLLLLMPLALLPLSRRFLVVAAAVVVAGCLVQVAALLFMSNFCPVMDYSSANGIDSRHLSERNPWSVFHFDPRYSPLFAAVRMLVAITPPRAATITLYPGAQPKPLAAVRPLAAFWLYRHLASDTVANP